LYSFLALFDRQFVRSGNFSEFGTSPDAFGIRRPGKSIISISPDFSVASYPLTRRIEKRLRRQASREAGTAS
jgi:hypothetical protein